MSAEKKDEKKNEKKDEKKEEEKDNEKIKDLLIKLQIVSKGYAEEKKKSESYLKKIRDIEKMLQNKENEINRLVKEKFDLNSMLTFEKTKQPAQNAGKKKSPEESTIDHYEEIINVQCYEIKNLQSKLLDEHNCFDEQKQKYQALIALQNEQVRELTSKNEQLKTENGELLKNHETITSMLKKFEAEKLFFDNKYIQYEQDKEKMQKDNDKLLAHIEKLNKLVDVKIKEIYEINKQKDDLAVQLNTMKLKLVDKQLTAKSFRVERIKEGVFNQRGVPITAKFAKNLQSNIYELIFQDDKEKNDVRVNLLDILSFEINEKNPNRIDIEYIINNTPSKISIIVHELLIDYFFQTYRDFDQKANEMAS